MEFGKAILAFSRLFEKYLKKTYQATGKGLGQQLKSVEPELKPWIRRHLWTVVEARNAFVHEEFVPDNHASIIKVCRKLAVEFDLPDPTSRAESSPIEKGRGLPRPSVRKLDESTVIASLEKLAAGRTFTWEVIDRDETEPDKPVIGVNLTRCEELSNADLSSLKYLKRLRKLTLNETRITDDGLACLTGLQALEELSICCTGVTDAGIKHLKRLRQLIILDIRANDVTRAGIKELKGLKYLQTLVVCAPNLLKQSEQPPKDVRVKCSYCQADACLIGKYGPKELGADLPDCEICIRHYY